MQVILENLYRAYFEARKNKRNTAEQLKFETCYESNLLELYQQIISRTYKVKPCKAFVIEKPVYREVFAPQFVDRVVHHFIVLYINIQVEKVLMNDCYSCRKGKGTLYGIQRAKQNMRSVTNNYAVDAYVLKLDISGYFMNMNKQLLHNQIQSLQLVESLECSDIEKETLKYLIEQVIFTNPVQQCIINGNRELWKFIPNNKSLFHSSVNCGLPIGNLTSQIFGNIYLNEFDHWVKEELKITHYGRYVDDMLFMHRDANYLKQCLPAIQRKMKEYGLLVHPKKIYFQHYAKGFEFLGRYIKPYRSYISNRTKNNFIQMLKKLETDLHKGDDYLFNNALLTYYRSCINSYLGIFMKANSYHFIKKHMLSLSSKFFDYYYIVKNQENWKCKLKAKFGNNGIILQSTCL